MQNRKDFVRRFLAGWDGQLGIDHVSYLANLQVHRNLPYVATNPAVVEQKVSLYKSAGFDFIRCTWQGPWSAVSHEDSILTAAECARQGMGFALLLDPGGMQKWNGGPGVQGAPAITANVMAALADPTTQSELLGSPAYLPGKQIYDFTTGAILAELAAKFTSLKFLAQNINFGWPNIPASPLEQVARNAASIAVQKAMNANPAMTDPCLCSHFNDSGQPLPVDVPSMAAFIAAGGKRNYNESVWSSFDSSKPEGPGNVSEPARILASFQGLFLQQQLAITPVNAPRIHWATGDDIDEGTEIESELNAEAGIVWST